MAIPVTALHILRVMLQGEQNLSGLQRDVRTNAQSWLASAQSENVPVETIAQYMTDAATEYSKRLNWITELQDDTDNWSKIAVMWAKLGGTGGDFSGIITPLTAVANGLVAANKSSYAAIISVCNQIIAAVNAPLSLWPE